MFSNIQAWVAYVSLQNLPANCLKLRSKDTSALNFTWDKAASQRTNQFDDESDLLLHETSVFLPVAMCFWSTTLYQANWLVWQGDKIAAADRIYQVFSKSMELNKYNLQWVYNQHLQSKSTLHVQSKSSIQQLIEYNLVNLHDDGNGPLQEIQKYSSEM